MFFLTVVLLQMLQLNNSYYTCCTKCEILFLKEIRCHLFNNGLIIDSTVKLISKNQSKLLFVTEIVSLFQTGQTDLPEHAELPSPDSGPAVHPQTCRENSTSGSPASHNTHPCCWRCQVHHHLPSVFVRWHRCQC